ncbi:sugar phosphate isomerase/epimerase family protein [Bradyrhizobium sp. 18BD]
MKLAIDSYCYHRFFGEVYPQLETDPGRRMTLDDFIARACAHRVEGISIESFMLDDLSPERLATLRRALDRAALERVWAWGHPRGLESGIAPHALDDLRRHIEIARALGAKVMRICAGGRRTRTLSWAEHKSLLVPLLRQAADFAAAKDIVLAIENHIDLLADELLELLTALDHPALGVCLDTANNLRMFEDATVVIEKLAPYTKAVHLKDISAFRGSPRDFGFWPSVPLGDGLIDIPTALMLLRRANYTGLLALEIDYLHPAYDGEEAAINQSLCYLRKALDALEKAPSHDTTADRAGRVLCRR